MTGAHASTHNPPRGGSQGAAVWSDAHIERSIVEVLHRTGQIDAQSVSVEVRHRVVTLRGITRCWSERHLIEKIAWAAPFVRAVHNYVTVGSSNARSTR